MQTINVGELKAKLFRSIEKGTGRRRNRHLIWKRKKNCGKDGSGNWFK